MEVLLKLVPSNVTKRFSSHVTEVKNIPATDGKPARVLLQILPSELHHHPDWPADPWSLEVDAVIGCDGIKSTVRNSIKLGDGPDRGGRVRYTGTYAYRGLLPMEEAAKQCGELVREPLLWLAPNKVCVGLQPDTRGLKSLNIAYPILPCRRWLNREYCGICLRSVRSPR